jgi:hypothetical protein
MYLNNKIMQQYFKNKKTRPKTFVGVREDTIIMKHCEPNLMVKDSNAI